MRTFGFELLFAALHVAQNQLGRYDLYVADGIDAAHAVQNVVVVEAPDDVHYRVDLPDIRQKFVAEPLAPARAGDEARDVDELNRRGYYDVRLCDLREGFEPVVRNLHHPDIGLYRAKGIIRRLRFSAAREGVEKGALAHIGQPDYACF